MDPFIATETECAKMKPVLRVPVVPRCSERKKRGTTSDHPRGLGLSPNGWIKFELIRFFCKKKSHYSDLSNRRRASFSI